MIRKIQIAILVTLSLAPLFMWYIQGSYAFRYEFLAYLTLLVLIFLALIFSPPNSGKASSLRARAFSFLLWTLISLNWCLIIFGYFHFNGTMPLRISKEQLNAFVHVQGHGWAADTKVYLPSQIDGASRLILKENGKPLPKPNSLHDDIFKKGHGRYSHWGRWVIFSASDDTSPKTNGRTYTIFYPDWVPWYLLGIALWQILLLSGLKLRGRFSGRLLLASLGAALALITLVYGLRFPPSEFIDFFAVYLNSFVFYWGMVIAAVALPLLGFRGSPIKPSLWHVGIRGIMLLLLFSGLNIIEGNYWWTTTSFPRSIPVAMHRLIVNAVLLFLAISYAAWGCVRYFRRDTEEENRFWRPLWLLSRGLEVIADRIYDFVGNPKKAVFFIVLMAASSRLLFSFSQAAVIPQYDNSYYDYWGQFLLLHHWLPPEHETVPFYTFFLAFVYWACGHSLVIVEIVNSILSVLGVYILYRTAYLGSGSPVGAMVAGLLATVFEWQFVFVHTTQIESFYIPLCITLLYCIIVFWRRPSAWTALLAGVLAAIVYMTRIQGLAYLVGCLLFFLSVRIAWRKRLLYLIVWVSPVLLCSLGWGWYNLTQESSVTLSSKQAQTRFSLHNSPLAKSGLPHVAELGKIGNYLKKKYPPPKVWWEEGNREALEFYRENPGVLLSRLRQRFLALLNWMPVSFFNNLPQNFWRDQKDLWLWNREIIFLLALALIGLVRNAKRPLAWMIFGIFALGIVSMLPFSTPDPRLRWPFDPPLFLLAGWAFCRMPRGLPLERSEIVRPRSILIFAGALVGAALILHLTVGRYASTQRWFPLEGGKVQFNSDICRGVDIDKKVQIIPLAQISGRNVGQMLITTLPLSNRWGDVPNMSLGRYLFERKKAYGASDRMYSRGVRYRFTVDFDRPVSICTNKDLREQDWVVVYGKLEALDLTTWFSGFRFSVKAILDRASDIKGFDPEADDAKLPYKPAWLSPG